MIEKKRYVKFLFFYLKRILFFILIKKSIYQIKSNILNNQILDPDGGGIIRDTIILPMLGFKTCVLMNTTFGIFIHSNGGILMSFQKKFWTGMLIITIISWCFAFHIVWIVYK